MDPGARRTLVAGSQAAGRRFSIQPRDGTRWRGRVMKVRRIDSTMHAAAFGAAALIASQVAGKATRDAFFLSQYPVTALPAMVIVASVLSIVAGVVSARMLSTGSSNRLLPRA